jgi:Bacterial Ig-like domain (group 3)
MRSKRQNRATRQGGHRNRIRSLRFLLILGVLLLTGVVGIGQAIADTSDPLAEYIHAPAEIQMAEDNDPQQTDPQAASELPHQDLDREEAQELMEGVFGPALAAPAGIFDELEVEKFLSDSAAVVNGGDLPEALTEDGAAPSGPGQSFLLESTVPLRVEDPSGDLEPVDLSLESTLGALRPANPLVDLTIPSQLGDGIQLPGAEVVIEVEGAPDDRAPSTLGDSVAFYPNVAKDTDLAVSPTPGGVETLSQLRSAEAPRSQTLNLDLPDGAVLEETADGGARAMIDGQKLITVVPPTALDADGNSVPVSLSVEESSVTVTAEPSAGASYPIAVDPSIEDNYNWYYDGHAGWTGGTTGGLNSFRTPDGGCSTYCFLRTSAAPGTYASGAQTFWGYSVPRFEKDWTEIEQRPTSWIQAYTVGNVTFASAGDWQANPQALFAVSDEKGAWRWAMMYAPNASGTVGANMNTDHTGRMVSFGLFTGQNTWLTQERYVLTATAQIALGDESAPTWGTVSSPTQWLNTEAKPFGFTVTDAGLGVYGVGVRTASGELLGSSYLSGCNGTVRSTCPRKVQGAQEGHTIPFNPTKLPQGTNNLKIEASDPLGNASSQTFQVKVDHTAPELALSGTITQQATVGNKLAEYVLKTEAKDGTTASPQSGIASVQVKIDGTIVSSDPSWSPGCTTQNCVLTKELAIKSSSYSVGEHTLEVVATDGAGIKSAAKTVKFKIERDTTAPQLTATTALYTAPEGWVEQKTYSYNATASDAGGSGLKSMVLKIDGTAVKTVTQGCSSGGCSQSLAPTGSFNMAPYSGGSHPAELIATDQAGNATTKSWTINVSPKGQISSEEAAKTLEAVDGTADTEVVVPPMQGPDGPGLKEVEGKIVSTGTDVTTILPPPTPGATEIQAPEGAVAFESSGAAGSPTKIVAGSAAVAGSTGSSTDSVSRAVFDGMMAFRQIRSPESTEGFLWTVELGPGQTLSSTSPESAEVYYEDGTPAMAILAEPAHDATGKSVPTSLAVEGADVIVLTVHHKGGGFVYPVVAGAGFHTGYEAVTTSELTYEGPPGEEVVLGALQIGAPQPAPTSGENADDEASASSGGLHWMRHFGLPVCGLICEQWEQHIKGFFYYDGSYAWWKKGRQPVCEKRVFFANYVETEACEWVGSNHQQFTLGGGPHGLSDWHISARLQFSAGLETPLGRKGNQHSVMIRGWGSGEEHAYWTTNICNPWWDGCESRDDRYTGDEAH